MSIWNGVITRAMGRSHAVTTTLPFNVTTTSPFNVTVTNEMSPFGPPCDSDLRWCVSGWGEVRWDRQTLWAPNLPSHWPASTLHVLALAFDCVAEHVGLGADLVWTGPCTC